MDKESDIETKYQKLAVEYSKVRSQVTVLKKAVLDEQAKNAEVTGILKNLEQTVRKRDQEMESITFRNDQLTKRIAVLQQDLQTSNSVKRGKHKPNDVTTNSEIGILNEEFQKKILENAQLFNSIADKDTEIIEYKVRIKSLEDVINNLHTELASREKFHIAELERRNKEMGELERLVRDLKIGNTQRKQSNDVSDETIKYWKSEAERWKTEYELLKSKPDSNDKLTDYYESQLSKILESKVLLHSETKIIKAENEALIMRLENLTSEYSQLKNNLEKSYEELMTTNNNYRGQLDAMTEHLAAQNEKITKQCDEIQFLKHKLSQKK